MLYFLDLGCIIVNSMLKMWHDNPENGLPIPLLKGISLVERLMVYCYTGDRRNLVPRIMKRTKMMDSLKSRAWPYINLNILNLHHNGLLNVMDWPDDADSKPILSHISSIQFWYPPQLAEAQRQRAALEYFGLNRVLTRNDIVQIIETLLKTTWIPDMTEFVKLEVAKDLKQLAEYPNEPFKG